MRVGLFFGSFNPIHVGHLIIANYMVEFTDLDKLWFVVSPHNPLKKKSTLLADNHRLELVHLAIKDDLRFVASNIEFKLPQPSYTIHTLAHLTEKYPEHEFVLIMGSDGLETFHKWKNFEYLQANYKRYIYPRPGTSAELLSNIVNGMVVNAPLIEISSTFIRESIYNDRDVRYFLNENVWKYIDEMNFYKPTLSGKK
ncbi:MAG TPA: nicotinate (nicotinamide) nucleotide adenylyltransferase [Bacteroidales bacterium]|nr:nicotinate (nicotinamide) nucleotide adenylyltransferase [Bacteroidales bacterium]